MSTVDKDALFERRLPVEEYQLPGGIGSIKIRGLNRAEAIRVEASPDTAARDLIIFMAGVVEPKLTAAEVRQWQDAWPAGELEDISRRIAELSGLLKEQAKEVIKTFRDEPDA